MNQIHELIAEWAGLECRCETEFITSRSRITGASESQPYRYWGNCPRHSNGGEPPDYDRDEVAVSLLPLLAAKTGKSIAVDIYPDGEAVISSPCFPVCHDTTIAAAITKTVIALLDKEQQYRV